MPGFCFSNTDWVSGIICPVISGLDTTATVTVPELLVLLLALPLEPLLEQAASATKAATEPTAPSVRSLNGRELIADHLRSISDVCQPRARQGDSSSHPGCDSAGHDLTPVGGRC